jgi:hypothetical protein
VSGSRAIVADVHALALAQVVQHTLDLLVHTGAGVFTHHVTNKAIESVAGAYACSAEHGSRSYMHAVPAMVM